MEVAEIAWTACVRHAAMQHDDELAAVLRLAADIQPRIIVEIGCMAGGGLFAWRAICDEVYGITLALPNPDYPHAHGAVVHHGDSHIQETKAWLIERLAGRPIDVLHIDGDHTHAGVKADYEMYAPLVRPGGLVFINDVINDWDAPDVGRFWQELDRGFIIASKRPRPIGFGVIEIETEGTAA